VCSCQATIFACQSEPTVHIFDRPLHVHSRALTCSCAILPCEQPHEQTYKPASPSHDECDLVTYSFHGKHRQIASNINCSGLVQRRRVVLVHYCNILTYTDTKQLPPLLRRCHNGACGIARGHCPSLGDAGPRRQWRCHQR
jgi:hypothetical protein